MSPLDLETALPLPEQFPYSLRKQIDQITYDYQVRLPHLCAALLEMDLVVADTTLTEQEQVEKLLQIHEKYNLK